MREHEKQLSLALLDSANAYYDINFSKNLVIDSAIKKNTGEICSVNELLGIEGECCYTELVEYWAQKLTRKEQASYFRFYNIERIKECYSRGERLLVNHYSSKGLGENHVQIVHKIRIYEDSETGDLMGLAYLTYNAITNTDMIEKYEEVSSKALLLESLSVNVPGGYHRCHNSEGFPLAFVSDSFLDVVGWTREQIVDELDNKYINLVAPEDREFFMSHEEPLKKNGRVDLAYRIVRRDGTRRWIQDATISMTKENETYYQCTLADITDYVERLNEEKVKAEASNHAKSAFLFNASHDIRTPMNAILGFAHIIEQNADNSEIVRDSVDKIIQSGNILMTLLNDVLELSRIEQGKEEVNLMVLDMESHAQNLFEMFSEEMENSEIEFVMKNDIEHRIVMGDDLKLTRIAMNLLSNAKKFTPKGGNVTFGIIEKNFTGEAATYCLYVNDTGIGMSKEFQGRAFEQFEREKTYTENGISGSGLGLAIIKRLCDLMDGECYIDSELGKGSNITVEVPLVLATGQAIKPEDINNSIDFSGKRILLVEDNDFNREIAMYALENMDVIVDEAENGYVAVDKILKKEAGYYDLILMDVQMPIMDGYTATREIRNIDDEKKSNIPIIAMTANAFQEDKDKCIEVGMNGHIAKPLNYDNLVAALSDAVKKQIN